MASEVMSKDERSLLLYLETCAVDQAGKVSSAHMNETDFDIAKRWAAIGYIRFSRLKSAYLANGKTHCVALSAEAWADARRLRRASRSSVQG